GIPGVTPPSRGLADAVAPRGGASLPDVHLSSLHVDPRRALVAVVGLLHLGNVVEPADDVRRAEGLAGLDVFAVEFLDEADVAALVAPGLADLRRVEGHAGQPGAGLAVQADLVAADHPLGDLALLALVEEALVGSEVLGEGAGGDRRLF